MESNKKIMASNVMFYMIREEDDDNIAVCYIRGVKSNELWIINIDKNQMSSDQIIEEANSEIIDHILKGENY